MVERQRSFVGNRSRKTDLAPGTPVLPGAVKREKAEITIAEYDGSVLRQGVYDRLSGHLSATEGQVTWIHIDGLQDMELLQDIGARYGIHELVLEDIVNPEQRTKVESYGDLLYLVCRMARMQEGGQDPILEQLSLLLCGNTVITFQEDGGDQFTMVRNRLKNETSRLRNDGADYLAYSLLDAVVDNYFDVLEAIGSQIEQVEELVLTDTGRKPLRRINRLRRQLLNMHRAIWPMREMAGALERGEYHHISKDTTVFLRDVHDHTIVAMETIDSSRDLLNGLLDIYLSAASNRMNEVMKVLTIISTIFMPLTFIVGVYGMNFRYMPELQWKLGYPAVWILIVVVVGFMLWILRKKKWI